MQSVLRTLAIVLVAAAGSLVLADSATTKPTTKPATQPAAAPVAAPRKLTAKIAPDAQKVLDELNAAYAKLDTLDVAGTTSDDRDVAGKKEADNDSFTATFQAPNKFRHEMKGNMLAGSTGEKAYVLSVEDNAYVQKDAPKERVVAGEAPKAVWDVVTMQNPSLAMAMSRNPRAQLVDGATAFVLTNSKEYGAADVEKGTEIRKADDVKLGEKSYAALVLTNTGGDFTFLIDAQSHLLRQVKIDYSRLLQHLGQADVKKAVLTFDYSSTTANGAVNGEAFAWVPPAGARELTAAAMAQDEGGGAGAALVGKPAPEFKLATPEGKEVALADQKGHVVVVDFWATWCGPCVASLPHLNKLYEDKKEAGLRVLAISVDENKNAVPPFVQAKKLTLTVLLDNDEQKVAEKYGVMGIPQTVVIGKDGSVKKVFVGFGPGSEDELKKVVEEAMK